jgi:hypothetical protein
VCVCVSVRARAATASPASLQESAPLNIFLCCLLVLGCEVKGVACADEGKVMVLLLFYNCFTYDLLLVHYCCTDTAVAWCWRGCLQWCRREK